MEKHKNSIDNLFREVLHDHKIVPSGRAKEVFLKEASEIPQRKWYRGGIFLFFILAILVIICGFAIYFIPGKLSDNEPSGIKSEPKVYPTEKIINSKDPVKPANVSSNNLINKTAPAQTKQTFPTAISYQENEESQTTIKSSSDQTKSIPLIENLENPINQNKVGSSTGEITLPVTNNPPFTESSSNVSATSDTSRIIPNNSYDTIVTQPPSADTKKEKKQRINKDWYFSTAIQYTPEWMFNTLEEEKFVNNFGVEGIFTIGSYSIRTGLGLSITKGTNELAVEYNDYLGSYNKLDSMSFSWDGSIHNYVPTYYMKSQDVWDSLMKLDYPKVVKRYTYLQIPLVLGYDFLRSGRFSVGLRAGPVLSILLKSKQLTEEYDPGNKKVISINNISPEQVSLNWQFMGGINASVRLMNNFLFEIEPMAKYYFNSVYEKSDITKKPWSIGIRAAFIIKF